jgi:REP element-mobilizing transposase RayT
LRIEYEGAWYHVMNRGRGRQEIFGGDHDYRSFLDTVGEAVHRYQLEVHAYCLMPNHYHLLVRTPLGNLSRIMRHIDGLYTQRHNRRADTDGPLFRGRYKAILVDADAYLLSVSRYIHRNPIDASRPLVKRPEDWPWSSYPAFINVGGPPEWLLTEPTLETLGGADRHGNYQVFVTGGVEEDVLRFYENQRASPVLGDERFRDWALGRAPAAPEVPRTAYRQPMEASQVLAAVATEWGLKPEDLTGRSRHTAPGARVARQCAMLLCRDNTLLTLREVGDLFGGIHYSGVSQNIRRVEEAIRTDERIAGRFESAKSRLDPF